MNKHTSLIRKVPIDDFYIVNMRKIRNMTIKQEKLHKLQETQILPQTTKLTFVHPTKCGGTAVENFLYENYRNFFNLNKGHGPTCLNHNNSVIIVRDPVDRFKSIYKYWKYGSGVNIRDETFLKKYSDVNVKQFIQFMKNNNTEHLFRGCTWDVHIRPITYWIKKTQLRNIIVLKYQKDINPSIQKLLHLLKIPTTSKIVPHFNVTKNKEKIVLDDDDIAFIREYYKTDYALWDKINNEPTLFRCVI